MILDGERFPEELLATYDIMVLRREDVEPKELRDLGFGSLRAKNTPLWALPFETFLVVDADTVVWGDMRLVADFEHFDFVLDRRGIEPLRSVMDVEAVSKAFPGFDARNHVGDYVNTGAYFGRRGALDLDRYLHAVRRSTELTGLFCGSQGAFNYLVFRSVTRGRSVSATASSRS